MPNNFVIWSFLQIAKGSNDIWRSVNLKSHFTVIDYHLFIQLLIFNCFAIPGLWALKMDNVSFDDTLVLSFVGQTR